MYNYIEESKKRVILLICGMVIVGIIAFFGIKVYSKDFEEVLEQEEVVEEVNEEQLEERPKGIVVYVTGEVISPGVIELDEEKNRIVNVIEKAGGTTSKADLENINLAEVVEDGCHIYVPKKGEIKEESVEPVKGSKTSGSKGGSTSKYNGLININKATAEELKKLNGIGSALAERIVDYRSNNGKFSNIEDLKKVNGIGEAKFNNIKDKITK